MESAEHAWIGDQVTLQFESGTVPSPGVPLPAGAHRLTYGQCIALGGDFYGVVGGPISTAADPRAAFAAAWESLASAGDETAQIIAIMAEEIAAVAKAVAAGRDPSLTYAALGDSLSKRWNVVTGGGSFLSDLIPMGRYLALAAENWDHFGEYAITAYRAGHVTAMDLAASIPGQGLSPQEAEARLQEAYAINAFADHFLTDLFSAGHLRAPRRELYDQVMTPVPGFSGSLGSLLVRCMHDEDSHHGLNVHNAAGDAWVAYGDKRLLDSVSADNRRVVVRAVQASADDVWNAYQGKPGGYGALAHVPDLARVVDVSTKENYSPLFRLQGDAVARRNDVGNRDDFSWTTDWWGWSTYALLESTHAYQHVKVYDLATKTFLGWLGCSSGNYVQVVSDEKDAHGVTWAFSGDDLYLRKDTTPTDRFLGLADYSYAGWGLIGGWRDPVVYNEDTSISLKSDPKRRLYVYEKGGTNWLCWSDDATNKAIVGVELALQAPSLTC